MDWFNTFALLLLAAGNVELLVTTVNRMHSRPWPSGRLKRIRRIHDLLVPVCPVGLLWFVGINGGILGGAEWFTLPIFWQMYLFICAFGVVGLINSSLRHVTNSRVRPFAAYRSQIHDIETELGERPVGSGPYGALLSWPGNEAMTVEVSEKELVLPELPEPLDGVSILHLSDLHMVGTLDQPFYERIVELGNEQLADMVVLTGDLLDDMSRVDWFPSTLGELRAPLGRFFILGNHDWDLSPNHIRASLSKLDWTDVAGRCQRIEVEGQSIAIAGTEFPWMGQHPYYGTREEREFRMLLSHTPDNYGWARQQDVDLMLSGHNHGGQVVLPLIGPVFSPSRFGCRYSSGVFWEAPTVAHVSRGISGRHPLRWNCRPELTKLILRCEVSRRPVRSERSLEIVPAES